MGRGAERLSPRGKESRVGIDFKVGIHLLVFPEVAQAGWPMGTKGRGWARRETCPGSGGMGPPRKKWHYFWIVGRPFMAHESASEEQKGKRWKRWRGEAGETCAGLELH